MIEQAAENTDREIWRREGNDPSDPDNYYQPSIHVTKEGAIGIDVGGYVYVKSIEEWHRLAGGKFPPLPIENELVEIYDDRCECSLGGEIPTTKD